MVAFIKNDVNTQYSSENKRIETVTCSKQQPSNQKYITRQPECSSAAEIEQINDQLTNSARYNKTRTMTCPKQLTHRKYKGDKTSAADMKQISTWLANKAGNK